jgi:competence protein ComEC
LGGLLLGDRSALPKDVTEEFKAAGLVHILVLSGYNVTIVAESLMKAFAFLPRIFAHAGGALSIVFFALMTGASATTVRASIMALIVILARSSSRRYDITRALLVAAFCMVLHNPMILAFDVSFQLSFLATLALIYVSPLVSEKLVWMTERWKLREILSATIATQIFVFPYLVYTMGQVSLISFVTNILVLPLVPYTMLLGFISSSLGFVSELMAMPLAWVSSIALSYIISIASISSKIPFAALYMKTSTVVLVFIYIFYAAYLIRAWRQKDYSQRSAN